MPGKQQHLATKFLSIPTKQPFLFCFQLQGKDNGQVNQCRLPCTGGEKPASQALHQVNRNEGAG